MRRNEQFLGEKEALSWVRQSPVGCLEDETAQALYKVGRKERGGLGTGWLEKFRTVVPKEEDNTQRRVPE